MHRAEQRLIITDVKITFNLCKYDIHELVHVLRK